MDSQYKGPINLGNPEEINIFNLASLINDKVGNNFELIYYPLPENDPSRRKPDITLAKRSLSWSPKINLSEGINQTINYFKENNLS